MGVHSGKWKYIPFILLLPVSFSAYKKSYLRSLSAFETLQLIGKLHNFCLRWHWTPNWRMPCRLKIPFSSSNIHHGIMLTNSNIHQVKTLIFPIPFSRCPLPSSDMERLLNQLCAHRPTTSPHSSPPPNLCPAPPSPLPLLLTVVWHLFVFRKSVLPDLLLLLSNLLQFLLQWWRSWSTRAVALTAGQTATTSMQRLACQP